MNIFALISGIIALVTTLKFITQDRKNVLKVLGDPSLEEVIKKNIQSFFSYNMIFLIFSTLFLLMFGFGGFKDGIILIKFISLNYLMFSVWELQLAFTSDIKRALVFMSDWMYFTLIALFAFLGTW